MSVPPAGDHELWELAQGGDRDAFATIYHRHAEAVWRHAYRLTASHTAAEDILAATFLTAWRRRAAIRFVADSARAWLLAVAGNEARTEWRRTRRHRRLFDRLGPAHVVDDHADSVVTSLDDRRRVHRVLAAIAELPPAQREAVALCLVAELPQPDAARALGISEATLRSRIFRARGQLRSALLEEVT